MEWSLAFSGLVVALKNHVDIIEEKGGNRG